MSLLLIQTVHEASLELDRIKNEILSLDPAKAMISPAIRDSNARIIASGYVWIAAILERFFREILGSLFTEMNSIGIQYDQLKPCLFSVACSTELISLKNLSDHKKIWTRRVDIFSRPWQLHSVLFKIENIPYDGKTIRPDHLETVWEVFGIKGSSIPSPIHAMALKDIADGRNEVVHGEIDPISFGRKRTVADFLKKISQMEDIILHVGAETESYLKNSEYLR